MTKMLWVALTAAWLAASGIVAADDGQANLGGNATVIGTFLLISPCNGENITGSVTLTVAVRAEIEDGHADVSVRTTYNAAGTGNLGTHYDVTGAARATYNTLSSVYRLPMGLTAKTVNDALNFSVLTESTIFTDAGQHPFVGPNIGLSASCNQ